MSVRKIFRIVIDKKKKKFSGYSVVFSAPATKKILSLANADLYKNVNSSYEAVRFFSLAKMRSVPRVSAVSKCPDPSFEKIQIRTQLTPLQTEGLG